MASYYDRLLLAIAAVMLAGAAVSLHPSIAFHQGLAGGSLASTLFLYEALFRHPPTEPTHSTTVATVVVAAGWLATIVAFL
jgi:hypothetical protein